jgi:hypothetical protein
MERYLTCHLTGYFSAVLIIAVAAAELLAATEAVKEPMKAGKLFVGVATTSKNVSTCRHLLHGYLPNPG